MFQLLEENIVSFVRDELKWFQRVLSLDYPEFLRRQREDKEVQGEEDEQKRSREAFLKITLLFLRRINQEDLADCLQNSKRLLTDFIYTFHSAEYVLFSELTTEAIFPPLMS